MSAQNALIVPLKLIYKGGEADDNRLDLYDGSSSLFGFAKSLQISTHFLLNQEIVSRAPAIRGARLFILPPKSGSFEQIIQIAIENKAIFETLGGGIITNMLYDFLKVTFSRAVGVHKEPETTVMNRLSSRLGTDLEPYLDDLSARMEGPLREAHRTIERDGSTITLSRPRSPLVEFNEDTLEYVKTRDENPQAEYVYGHVTRYNVITGNGRFYDNQLGKVVPFWPEKDFAESDSSKLLTWSIDQEKNGEFADICMKVRRIVSARDITKRYIAVSCRELTQEEKSRTRRR